MAGVDNWWCGGVMKEMVEKEKEMEEKERRVKILLRLG